MFTDIEQRCLQVKQDQTFTDDWEGTRCLPTSNKDVYRHQGKNTFMKRNHLPMAKMKYSIFTDSENTQLFKRQNHLPMVNKRLMFTDIEQ
jgi:hypothetical protein